MKTLLHAAFWAFLLAPMAGHASPSPADSTFICLQADSQLEEPDSFPAAKRLANLHAGEPRTVRMIYFLPNDRPYRPEVVDSMRTTIRQVQTFFSEQMEAHGYGNRTFRFETDADGMPVVHRLDGQHPDSHYLDDTFETAMSEVFEVFDLDARHINLLVIDNSTNLINRYANGMAESRGKYRGDLLVTGGFRWTSVAHELGHTFGLKHDFRDGAYMMSYGANQDRLSFCAAEFLAIHPYFTADVATEESRPTLELLSSPEYPASATRVSLQLSVDAPGGLHQAFLSVRTRSPHPASGFSELVSCRGFQGEHRAVVEFGYTGIYPSDGSTSLSDPYVHPVTVRAVDRNGNTSRIGIILRPSPTLRGVTTLEGDPGQSVHSLAFSPDGTSLAVAHDRTIRLWDMEKRTSTAISGWPTRVAFSPKGTILAAGTHGGPIELWDLEKGAVAATLEGHTDVINSLAFSPDGMSLASGSGDQSVKLWDVERRANVATFEGHTGLVSSVAFSPDGLFVASGAWDKTVKLWDVRTGENVATLTGHRSTVQAVAFAPDGSTLVSGTYWDDRIRLWDITTGRSTASFSSVQPGAHSVVFSPDGATLAFGSGENFGTIELWDTVTRRRVTTLSEPAGGVRSLAFSPDGLTLASGGFGGHTVRLWDLSEWMGGRPRRLAKIGGDSQKGRTGTPLADPFVVEVRDQDGNGIEGVVVIFTIQVGEGRLGGKYTVEKRTTDAKGRAQTTFTLGPDPGPVTVEASVPGLEPVAFSVQGTGIAPPATVVDHETGHLPDGAIARLGKGRLGAIAFSPDDRYLAGAGSIGAWIYDVATTREVALFTGHEGTVRAVAFSPDGTTLATGSGDQTVKVWDMATGLEAATLRGHPGQVTSLAFSPDGSVLASGSYRFRYGEGVVFLWETATGQNTYTLWGHAATVTSVAFSPDGSILASAGGVNDNTIRLWDVEAGTPTAIIEGHAPVYSVAFLSRRYDPCRRTG